jgi:hypothetical protein
VRPEGQEVSYASPCIERVQPNAFRLEGSALGLDEDTIQVEEQRNVAVLLCSCFLWHHLRSAEAREACNTLPSW